MYNVAFVVAKLVSVNCCRGCEAVWYRRYIVSSSIWSIYAISCYWMLVYIFVRMYVCMYVCNAFSLSCGIQILIIDVFVVILFSILLFTSLFFGIFSSHLNYLRCFCGFIMLCCCKIHFSNVGTMLRRMLSWNKYKAEKSVMHSTVLKALSLTH